MMKSGKRKWSAVGNCVQGNSHIKNDIPCQDALRIERLGRFQIVCLSDGHGSSSCPYSAEGAQAAVDTAFEVFASILEDEGDSFHTISSNKDIWLPKQIEKHWKHKIQKLHQETREEEPFKYELYGATLLSLIAADDFVFALQLGDGDILSIQPQPDDLLIEWFIPPDGGLGPETNSLCQDDCWQYMTAQITSIEAKAPSFLMSTDGYANSFADDKGFKKAGADFYELWKDRGLPYIEENLAGWLMESSAQGSGDDITLALVVDEF